MATNKIYTFNTHYEIRDYHLGDNVNLERMLTYHDFVSFTDYPKYHYDKTTNTLYIPRGFDELYLEQYNGKPLTYMDCEYKEMPAPFIMTKSPRNESQEKAIRYLLSKDEFRNTPRNQKVLIMPPSYGKTFCAVYAISKLHVRSLIIVHTQNLKEQWMERICEYTNLGGPNIVDISSSAYLNSFLKKKQSSNQKIFIVTRSLLASYIERYGMKNLNDVLIKMGIGIKIFDEAHKEYHRILQIDYATDVKRTWYLTATFALSNASENRVFQRAFNIVNKCKITPDDAKHIVYIPVLFNTRPNAVVDHRVTGKKRGFDKYSYIDYELKKGTLEYLIRYILQFFLIEKGLEGKTLLLSSKKTTCDYLASLISDETKLEKVCAYYTGNKVENYKSYDAICATSAMLGTGEDIPGLRFMLNTEPGASLPNTDQFSGRLRPYYKDGKLLDTYYIEFIDVGFQKLMDWYERRKKLLEKKVKVIHELDMRKGV